jgi:hypothetical protein
MKIIHELINKGKGTYGTGQSQITRDNLLRIYDEQGGLTSLSLTTVGTSGPATYNPSTQTLNVPNYTQQFQDLDGFVPYLGAIANVNLGSNQLITDATQFNLAPVATTLPAPGKLKWNVDTGTLDLGMGYTDVVQQVGMDTFYPPAKNQTGTLITKGTAVMAVGTLGASGRILIAPAIADGSVRSKYMLGIVPQDIANGADGVVMWFGELRGFNTITKAPAGETWADGDVLWLNPAIPGGLTKNEPQAPNIKVSVAFIIHAASNGVIMIRPSLGSRLTDLHDVDAFSPANKDLIYFNSGSGHWDNTSLGSLIGGTSSQFLKGDGTLDSNTYITPSYTGSLNITGSLILNGINLGDVNNYSIFRPTGSFQNTTNNIGITGSLVLAFDGVEDYFQVTVAGVERVKVNTEGTLQLASQSVAPTAVAGGIYYNNADEFYLGFNS